MEKNISLDTYESKVAIPLQQCIMEMELNYPETLKAGDTRNTNQIILLLCMPCSHILRSKRAKSQMLWFLIGFIFLVFQSVVNDCLTPAGIHKYPKKTEIEYSWLHHLLGFQTRNYILTIVLLHGLSLRISSLSANSPSGSRGSFAT